MKQLSNRCYNVLNFYYGNLDSFYAPETWIVAKKRILEEHNLLNQYILAHIKEEKFQKEIDRLYTIQLYCVVYLEEELENGFFLELVNKLLSLPIPDYYVFSPILLILLSNSDLTEELVEKIYEKIRNEILPTEYHSTCGLGNPPYDYRYHILKREETSKSLVSKILNSYDEVSLEELKEYFQTVLWDMNEQLVDQKIKRIEDIKGNKELERDFHYFQIIQEYIKNRNSAQKPVYRKTF